MNFVDKNLFSSFKDNRKLLQNSTKKENTILKSYMDHFCILSFQSKSPLSTIVKKKIERCSVFFIYEVLDLTLRAIISNFVI